MIDRVWTLIQSTRASLIAPAGCGKTHLIAEAVAHRQQGCDLILTHTHAGVAALKKKCKELGAKAPRYQVETIAGWSLRFASAFPQTSGLADFTPSGPAWEQVYMSAAKALDRNPLREVVRCSYSGVYVDEYQDCTIPQHDLILKLAEVLPCRILGDPLQGIFDFRKNECVDWDQHVSPNFEALPEMDRYWRWEKANRRLGSWLTWFRKKVVAGGSVDLRNGPVTWRNSDRYIIPISESLRIARTDDESVVAIHQWPTQCHAMAGKLKNVFTCIEPIDCGDLFETAQKFEETSGLERARAVLHFACDCMTQVGTHLSAVRKALEDGREPKVGRGAHSEEIKALLEIALNSSYEPVLRALKKMRELPNVVLRRGELYSEMLRALDEFNKGKYDSLSEAAWHVRNRTRQMGRRPIRCTVGRTVLVKGLEFDHCIVFDAENLEKKNLYVAFTRGSKSLAVFSKTPILTLK